MLRTGISCALHRDFPCSELFTRAILRLEIVELFSYDTGQSQGSPSNTSRPLCVRDNPVLAATLDACFVEWIPLLRTKPGQLATTRCAWYRGANNRGGDSIGFGDHKRSKQEPGRHQDKMGPRNAHAERCDSETDQASFEAALQSRLATEIHDLDGAL